MVIDEQKQEWARLVREKRRAKGLTQEQLAIGSGFSLSYLQKIENGVVASQEAVDAFLAKIRKAKKQ